MNKTMKENEVINNILTRVSNRRFTDEPVSNELVETLLRAAMAAPSAMDYTPWHFVVVGDTETKRELKASLPYVKMMNDASTGIVVCGDTSLYERISQIEGEDNTLYWVQDCSAASQNILLAAHSLGLAAVWTGIFPLQSRIGKLQRLLSLPAHIVPLNLIVVGHPAAEAKPKDKWNAQRIHHEKW